MLTRLYLARMETRTHYDDLIAFRALKRDKAELTRIARGLQLDESEIARRALRAGLKILADVRLPGGCEERSNG
jgi:hypothetical protein